MIPSPFLFRACIIPPILAATAAAAGDVSRDSISSAAPQFSISPTAANESRISISQTAANESKTLRAIALQFLISQKDESQIEISRANESQISISPTAADESRIKISQTAANELRIATLQIKGATVFAEIADTPTARRAGFSHRSRPAANAGILFVFSPPRMFCLWMRDVSFALDAAFIDAAGKIIGAAKMSPHTETRHCPPRPAKYALEVNADWLRQNKVQIGDLVFGLPDSSAE